MGHHAPADVRLLTSLGRGFRKGRPIVWVPSHIFVATRASILIFLPPHSTTSYQYLLASLRNLPSNSPHAESTAIQAISTSLKLPSVFDFDTLFKIDAIIQLQGHELFSLLRVFLSGGLEDYKKWESEHPGSTEKYGDCPHYRVSRGYC